MKHIVITLFVLAAALSACKAPYAMETPASFRKYEDTKEFKMITANGVMLKAREVDNYPKGDLPFWTDAMGRHLEQRGYVLKETACFTTNAGKKGCTLTFLLPHGTEDWTFSETLFIEEDDIVLVEAAGPYDRFAKIEGELARALKTFEPRPK
jgi:hypothetical protein